MKRVLILSVIVGTLFTSCKKDKHDKAGIFKGPEVQYHHGKAWTWVGLDGSGNPLRLAVTINDAAVNSMPVGNPGGNPDHHHHDNNVVLPFHQKAKVAPFDHIDVGWNPLGHEPTQIYGAAHFDFHFYMMTPQELAVIPPYNVDSSKFKNWPGATYLPANYMNFGGGAPKMGCHWIDVTSPEIGGAPLTQTFIYGSYDGKVNFYEPMITKTFLMASTNFERTIPQPAKVQKTGWYPTKMKIVKHDGLTDIILDGFVHRTQS